MEKNISAKLIELTHIEMEDISGGNYSIWRYVGMYVRFIQGGMDSTQALITAGGAAYAES
jgi:hypothetical protein